MITILRKVGVKCLRISLIEKVICGKPKWLRGLAPPLAPGRDPGVLGSSPASGSLPGACFSLCLCLCLPLSLSLCLMNKFKKSLKKIKNLLKKQNKTMQGGAPGWLRGLSDQLLILAQAMISGLWDGTPHWALHSASNLLEILSLSLCSSLH